MKSPDISGLVAGVLTIIGIAIALGQYGRLEAWSRRQAAEAMTWKRGLPYFFAPHSGHGHARAGSHSRESSRAKHPAPVQN